LIQEAKIGIMTASLLAAIIGTIVMGKLFSRNNEE
jgi:Na+/H+ antiporter NhaA